MKSRAGAFSGTVLREAKGMTKRRGREELESLANIGAEVAARLREAGIATPERLARLGSVEAAVRLAEARPEDPPCRSMLSGLEGALRGVRWHAIPKQERERLWLEFCRRAAALKRDAEGPGAKTR